MSQPERPTTDKRDAAIYHVVYAHESFNEAAQALFELIRLSERHKPGTLRRLFLDIEGHRNDHGGFDDDMLELQQTFLPHVLSQYVSEISTPLYQMKNPGAQDNDIPAELRIEHDDTH